MPGIAGIITRKPRQEAAQELARMLASMRHESFYATGTWIDEDLGVYVGWVERTDEGRCAQPQVNERGDKVLVFSGEEFPEPRAVQRLQESGHRVQQGRGAHLVHVAEDDAAFPASLNGQFHGLIVDRTKGTATLFNDRYASRRIYYHEAKDGFYFAAEAKALLAVRPELRVLDERGLGEYVSCGCVMEDRTLFKGIRILPWAAAWVFRRGVLNARGSYFSPKDWEEQPAIEPENYFRELREVFARNLPRYFEGGGHVGFSLTGGLDTRMMLAWHLPEPGSIPCYTFAGAYRECRDVRIARRVAGVCGQTHQAIVVGEDFLGRFPHYAERSVYLTDGSAGVQDAANLYANALARRIAPIRLTGNFGDEVLRNWIVFRPTMAASALFDPDFRTHLTAAADTYADAFKGRMLTHAVSRQISWFFYGLSALEMSQVEMRSPFIDNDLIRMAYRAPQQQVSGNQMRVKMIRAGNAALGRIRTDLGFAGRGGPVAEGLCRFWNRATMRAEYACEFGDPRWVPIVDRALLGRTLEKTFVGIHKFTHFSLWYRDALAEYVRAILLDRRTLARPYLQASAVEAMVEQHVSGAANHTAAIHKFLNLEHIHRLFVDAT